MVYLPAVHSKSVEYNIESAFYFRLHLYARAGSDLAGTQLSHHVTSREPLFCLT